MYALDDEWLRRYPEANGRLACAQCVAAMQFDCGDQDPAAHLQPTHSDVDPTRCDSWHHLLDQGLVKAIIWEFPDSAVDQGAREYLEFALEAQRLPLVLMARVQRALHAPPGLIEEFSVNLDRRLTDAEEDFIYRRHPHCHIKGLVISEVTVLSQGTQAMTRLLSDLRELGVAPSPQAMPDRLH